MKKKVMDEEFVEIADIKWAKRNIGAKKETDAGLYFQWGDAQGYAADEIGIGEDENLFNQESYKYGISGGISIIKYNSADGKTVIEASDDAVTANWGNDWRMPTKDEFDALGASVNAIWTDDYKGSGVAGMVCTDKTDSSKVLFFPACGYCFNGSNYGVSNNAFYWSSSIRKSNVLSSYCMYLSNGDVNWQAISVRYCGYPVRGVMK